MIDVEKIDSDKLAELLSASFDGTLDTSAQRVLEKACQHPDNTDVIVQWLKFEAAMRSVASPSVMAKLSMALQHRRSSRQRPVRGKIRWAASALFFVVGAALAATYYGFGERRNGGDDPPIAGQPAADPVVNRLPVFVAEETAPALPDSESRDGKDASVPEHTASPSPRIVGDFVVARYDFESGTLPPEFKNGRVIEPATVRAGSRFAAQGMREKYAPNTASVMLMPDWDFAYDETLVIRFRYLMVEPALRIRLQIYNHDQRQNYQLDLTGVHHGQWTDAEFLLADMKPVRDTVRHMVAGDRLTIVYVMGGAPDGNAILVDDLTVLRRGR